MSDKSPDSPFHKPVSENVLSRNNAHPDYSCFKRPFRYDSVACQEFRHIVLIVRSGGRYGALGISRRKELMFKDLVYDRWEQVAAESRAFFS